MGSAEETTALPFGFFDRGSLETALAEDTPLWPVHSIGSSEETPSFPFDLLEIRSPETWDSLLGFIVESTKNLLYA